MKKIPYHSLRKSCRLCNSKSVKVVVPLKAIPVGEHYFEDKLDRDIRYPIDLYQCVECTAVQTLDDIGSEFLWSGYTYFSGQTKGIVNHFEKFVDSLADKLKNIQTLSVFDVGSNDGTLLSKFRDKGCRVFGIDPSDTAVKRAKEIGIQTYLGLFSDTVVDELPQEWRKVDIITAFNVFAHSADMQGMINGIKKMLNQDGLFYFEVQYLLEISKKKLLGTIFHEHMIHYSTTSAENFLIKNGLRLIDFEINNIQNGSIIFCASLEGSKYPTSNKIKLQKDLEKDSGILGEMWGQEFLKYIQDQSDQVKKIIEDYYKRNIGIVGYGAARSGPTLAIQYGLEYKIEYLIDDHASKVGKYGTFRALKVYPTSHLYKQGEKLVVIFAWIHTKNIIKNHIDYINSGGEFLLLWPFVKIINKSNVAEYIGNMEK